MTPSTISEAYRSEQQRLHDNPRYGIASLGYAPLVASLLRLGACQSLSDYGAGKRKLEAALGSGLTGVRYHPYDPAFPHYGEAQPADLVTCIDVLEHVEPELLDNTLDHLAIMTRRLALLTVHTGPAKKTLSDGRNAHLTQQPLSWWLPRLSTRFDVVVAKRVRKGFFAIVCPKGFLAQLASTAILPAILRAAAQCNPRPSLPARSWRAVGRDVGAIWLAATDKRTPNVARLLAAAAAVVAISPIDLTPDVIPGLKHADDLLLLLSGLVAAALLMPRQLVADLRSRSLALGHAARVKAAALLTIMWLPPAGMFVLRLWHLRI